MKLATGQRFIQQDIDDARASVAWMRDKLCGITCYAWYDTMMEMDRIEAEKMQEKAA